MAIDYDFYEEANEIVYRDLSVHIAICATPCFKPNTDYKYFSIWKHWMEYDTAEVIRIDMREPKYITGRLSDEEVINLIKILNSKESIKGELLSPVIYKSYDKSYIHTVWEDLNYFNDWNLDKDIDILPMPDYTKLNK